MGRAQPVPSGTSRCAWQPRPADAVLGEDDDVVSARAFGCNEHRQVTAASLVQRVCGSVASMVPGHTVLVVLVSCAASAI